MANDCWYSCSGQPPPEGLEVLTMISDSSGERNRQTLKRKGNLWFVPDGSIYVYYTPSHWQLLNPADEISGF